MVDNPHPFERHTDYGQLALEEGHLLPDPIEQFQVWLDDADREGVYEPNAMVLSTIDPDGRPSGRTVLLRSVDERGFAFFTDYTSRKGRALQSHPDVAAVFPWYSLHRQVLIHGVARRVAPEWSDEYFQSRPRGSKIGAWASDQSQPIESRAALERKIDHVEERFRGEDEVPRPEKWGGFVIVPETIEFWAGRRSRLHDRIRFCRQGDSWTIERLQP